MKHLLNTLYVTTQQSYLAKEGEALVVRVEHETRLRVPVHTLSGIICFGTVTMSPQLMEFCSEKSIGISFLSENGHFHGRVQGPVNGNVLLRREQYRWADSKVAAAGVASSMVIGKVANARNVLLRAARERADDESAIALGGAATRLGYLGRKIQREMDLDILRGIEGEAAQAYFGVFDNLIVSQKQDFMFTGRNRRPPLDPVNALLSFVYTLLAHDARSALESVGLDPYVGFLHADRPGRPSLALDLMEELRPILADRLVLSLINLQQVRKGGFRITESGAVLMDDQTRKEVIVAYQKRKQEEVIHPFLEEKIAVGLVLFAQAQLLARHIRGDLDAYPPFVWK